MIIQGIYTKPIVKCDTLIDLRSPAYLCFSSFVVLFSHHCNYLESTFPSVLTLFVTRHAILRFLFLPHVDN